ncbi:phasin family protein [Paenibacillus sp. HJGM_3]|uniref:phasin family protein n=1 Tax=Paenibacillus sp. HJGM_3 TaxID=3379816 RepID=UPI00385A7BAC
MKDTIQKAISLGLGLVIASKEQIEKTVDELVKKGEVNRAESKAMVEELIRKGEDTRQQIEAVARERVNAVLGERWATREELERLEQRLEALERKVQPEE